jgi:hypothetical protein
MTQRYELTSRFNTDLKITFCQIKIKFDRFSNLTNVLKMSVFNILYLFVNCNLLIYCKKYITKFYNMNNY